MTAPDVPCRHAPGVGRRIGLELLQGHSAAEPPVVCGEDAAHASLRELAFNQVVLPAHEGERVDVRRDSGGKCDDGAILEAIEACEARDFEHARHVLGDLLARDLRCIAALWQAVS